MKSIKIIFLFTLSFISCSKSGEKILIKVSKQLSDIETVRYDSRLEIMDEGQILADQMASFAFDFRNVHPLEAKHYLQSETSEIIYNGKEVFNTNVNDRIILTSKETDLEQINNPMFMTLKPLVQILPKVIRDNEIIVERGPDTLIGKTSYYSVDVLLKDNYIDWINAEIVSSDVDAKYKLFIDKASYLPFKVISPNGEAGSFSRTLENIETDYEFPEGLWSGDLLPKTYKTVSMEAYFGERRTGILDHIGEKIIDFNLPLLSSNLEVTNRDLEGKVILFDFWWQGCGPCIAAIPSLNDISEKFKNDDFKIFGVEYHEKYPTESIEAYIKKYNSTFPHLHHGKTLAANYGVVHAPTFMIMNKIGEIVHIDQGYSEEGMKDIVSIIENHL